MEKSKKEKCTLKGTTTVKKKVRKSKEDNINISRKQKRKLGERNDRKSKG